MFVIKLIVVCLRIRSVFKVSSVYAIARNVFVKKKKKKKKKKKNHKMMHKGPKRSMHLRKPTYANKQQLKLLKKKKKKKGSTVPFTLVIPSMDTPKQGWTPCGVYTMFTREQNPSC